MVVTQGWGCAGRALGLCSAVGPIHSSILFNVVCRLGLVFFFCVSFLPPDLRRGKKYRLPLCTWFKTALWNWQDGDVAHTKEMIGICKGGTTVRRTYRKRLEAPCCTAIAVGANETSSNDNQPCHCVPVLSRGKEGF